MNNMVDYCLREGYSPMKSMVKLKEIVPMTDQESLRLIGKNLYRNDTLRG